MISKCSCHHCGNPIEFEAEQSGAVVACPHCSKQTTLDVNQKLPPVPTPIAPANKTTIAKHGKVSFWIAGLVVAVVVLLASNLILLHKLTLAPAPSSQLGKGAADISVNQEIKNSKPVILPQGMEFSAALMKNFPERVQETPGGLKGKVGWMDVEFVQIYNQEFDHFNQLDSSTSVGMMITDKNGNMFSCCYADKAKWGDFLLGLKYGDKIRLIGQAMMFLRNGTDADFVPWLRVDSIQVMN